MTDPAPTVDLLLLNASNYGAQPIFPYAFVQVSALARTRGLTVVRCDLLGTDRVAWSGIVADLVRRHAPRMVGFHVRQADSQLLPEYAPAPGEVPAAPYFPVDDTRDLVAMVRAVTAVPVVVGGFGFSLHRARMFAFLGADYGIVGGPDAFFDAFDALAARDLSGARDVANLMFRHGEEVASGPVVYFGPLDAPEYDEEILGELRAFYDRHGVRLSRDGNRADADVAVEVLRGCPCRCYFCTEPTVKGKRLQPRSFEAIFADVAFLAERDVRVVWFVCSELNMGGMAFALALAERMRRFNADRGDRRVLWRAYAMPRPGMTRAELEVLMASGYLPGWNEFASFDDGNLRACRMPYRAADAIDYYRTLTELTADPAIHLGVPASKFELFLGNAFMTAEAMRATLAVVDREGFSDRLFGDSVTATRVYRIGEGTTCGDRSNTFTITPAGRTSEVDTLHPTFHYAPALIAALGSEAEVDTFLRWVSSTLLTRSHEVGADLAVFLATATTPAVLAEHVREVAPVGLLVTRELRRRRVLSSAAGEVADAADAVGERIWAEPSAETTGVLWDPETYALVRATAARTLLGVLSRLYADRTAPVLAAVGLGDPGDRGTAYRMMRRLYARFDSVEAVIHAAGREPGSVEVLLLRYLLFVHGVRIVPAYRPLLFEPS